MTDRARFGAFIAAGLAVAVVLALFVAPEASTKPDGLEKVAIDEGFVDTADDHAFAGLPTADYAVRGVDDERLGTGLAGLIGVTVTFLVAGAVFVVLRRTGRPRERPSGAL